MQPLIKYVIIKPITEDQTESGLLVPKIGAYSKGKVIASGSKQIDVGDTVLYTGGTKYEEYIILHISSIVAKL